MTTAGRKNGFNIRTEVLVSIAVVTLAILGYFYSTGREVSDINARLDRNCRILASIQADVRFIIVEHTSNNREAQSFREIFNRSAIASCG